MAGLSAKNLTPAGQSPAPPAVHLRLPHNLILHNLADQPTDQRRMVRDTLSGIRMATKRPIQRKPKCSSGRDMIDELLAIDISRTGSMDSQNS